MKTKLLALILVLSLLLSMIGCTQKKEVENNTTTQVETNNNINEKDYNEQTKSDPVEVEFWTMQLSPTFDDYLNGVIEEFQSQNSDIIVKWVDIPWGDMEKKILAAAASGDMPDIANLNPHFAQKLAQFNALVDMEQYAADVKNEYFDGAWEASQFEGKTFGLPWYLTTGIIYYNKAIFEEAGLDPSNPPKTFNEMYEVAKVIKEKTGKYAYFTALSQQSSMEDFEKMGVRLFNDDYTVANFTSKELIEGVKLYKAMLDEDLMPQDSLTKGLGDAIQMFSAGELALFQGGTSHAGMIESNNIDVYENTGVAQQLVNEGGKVNVAVMNIAVSEMSENKEEAVKFAKFITNAENQLEFAKAAGGIVPSTKESIHDDFFTKEDGTAKGQARIASASQISETEVIFPPIKNWSDIKDAFIEALQKSLVGETTPEDAFKEAEQKANEALNN